MCFQFSSLLNISKEFLGFTQIFFIPYYVLNLLVTSWETSLPTSMNIFIFIKLFSVVVLYKCTNFIMTISSCFFSCTQCFTFCWQHFCYCDVIVWTFNTRCVHNLLNKKANIPLNLVWFLNGVSFLFFLFLKFEVTNELNSLLLLKSKKAIVVYSKQDKTLLSLKC